MKAVLTEGDSVLDAVTDIVSFVTTHRQTNTTLTVPCGNVCEHIELRKSAKKEEVEVKQPTPFSQDWVVRQVMTEAQDGPVKVHLHQWMIHKHHQETNDELVSHLQKPNKEQLKEVTKALGGEKRYI